MATRKGVNISGTYVVHIYSVRPFIYVVRILKN